MIFVDSNVWIDFFSGAKTVQTEFLAGLIPHQALIVGDIVLLEVLQGCRSDKEFQLFRHAMTAMPVVTIGGQSLAVRAAANFRLLRAKGITIRKTIDTLIATWCIDNGYALLTGNRDFEPFFEHLGLVRALGAQASSTGATS